MKIKWKTAYGSLRGWVSSDSALVITSLKGNFAATHEGRKILVIMSRHYSPAGHGEGSYEYDQPNYVDATTLEALKLSDPVLDVELDEKPTTPSQDLKRFLLFVGSTYYPEGGFEDFEGSFDSIADAAAYIKAKIATDPSEWNSNYRWMDLVDGRTGKRGQRLWGSSDELATMLSDAVWPAKEGSDALTSPTPVATTEQRCRLAISELLRLRYSLSYNLSYCGEDEGNVKSVVAEWERQGAKPL